VLSGALPPQRVERLVRAARPVYDLARISVGHPFGLTLDHDGLISVFTYGIDELRTLRIERQGDDLKAEVVTRSYDVQTASVSGVITSSLFAAIMDTGESDQLALDLADIFAWDVDFNTEIQRGDSFRVAVEKMSLDGTFRQYGRILAAEFTRGTRVLKAVRFEGARGVGYYGADGRPLRKAFLRSPLKFTRISSGFTSARFHPILGRYTSHYGIDYAAPVGTPVHASADGVVALAGWSGGFGNTVRLRHANGYETLYGHLSRINVRPGQRVAQGDRIGAVGTTGLSTGPHLDYRMMRNGGFVNPLKIQIPPAEPIASAERAAFERVRDERLALFTAAVAPVTASAETPQLGRSGP
jgi:murein DD-endopeptidase MepM/ murein hydrolase activator NlpD